MDIIGMKNMIFSNFDYECRNKHQTAASQVAYSLLIEAEFVMHSLVCTECRSR